MSTEEVSTLPAPAGTTIQAAPPPRASFFRSPAWIFLLVAVAVRAWLTIHTQGIIEGDEALLGLQAEQILRGSHPIYFWAQPYMGTLEAHLVALLFWIAGPSAWTLRLEPVLLSPLLMWLTWKLANALADLARLPDYARSRYVTFAMCVAAMPPLYDLVIELRTYGGYIETFILTLWLLLSAIRLTQRWHEASTREMALRWMGIGLLTGLGLWVYPLIIMALLAAALWIAGYILIELVRIARQKNTRSTPGRILKGLRPALAAIPAALVGFAPGIYWGLQNNWANIRYLVSNSNGLAGSRLATIQHVTTLYMSCTVPRIIGGALPTDSGVTAANPRLLTPGLIVGGACLLITLATVGFSTFLRAVSLLLTNFDDRTDKSQQMRLPCCRDSGWIRRSVGALCLSSSLHDSSRLPEADELQPHEDRHKAPASSPPFPLSLQDGEHSSLSDSVGKIHQVRRLVGLPLLFAGCSAVIFCTSSISTKMLVSGCGSQDPVGRYATPLLLALPFLFAAPALIVSLLVARRKQAPGHSRGGGGSGAGWGPLWSPSGSKSVLQANETVETQPASAQRRIPPILSSGLLATLLIYAGIQGYSYLRSDPNYTMQTSGCTIAPANDAPVIAYMQREHIQYAWASGWVGNAITFATDGALVVIDPRWALHPSSNRIPAYTAAILHAARASVLLLAPHDDAHPTLLQRFDQEHITYTVARFPSEPGIDLLVITPLNRTVAPSDGNDLGVGFGGC